MTKSMAFAYRLRLLSHAAMLTAGSMHGAMNSDVLWNWSLELLPSTVQLQLWKVRRAVTFDRRMSLLEGTKENMAGQCHRLKNSRLPRKDCSD